MAEEDGAQIIRSSIRVRCFFYGELGDFNSKNSITWVSGCGGVINSLNQTIAPPSDGGDGLGHDQNCTWIIVAPLRSSVHLNWISFDMEESDDCAFDYVSVSDGTNGTASRRYCGTNIPAVMTSISNVIRITFVSDSSVRSQGFSLTYSFESGNECEYLVIRSSQDIFERLWWA